MRLIVETNFVLEIALLQAEIQDCHQILDAAEDGRIHLVVPAYVLAEPNETLVRRHKQREDLNRGLTQELNQLTRSEPYAAEKAGIDAIYALLLRSAQEERKRLEDTISRLIAASQIVPLDSSILLFSQELQKKHDISPQDSLILA